MDYHQELQNILKENVSRETFLKLEQFVALLLKWNNKINLVSKNITEQELWFRHIFDSVQLTLYIKENSRILDLGSGAGFPAIPLSITHNYQATLVESDIRKCAFLQEAAAKIDLPITVINKRIENIDAIEVDVVTSRALASLQQLLEYSHKFTTDMNFMLFLKGQNVLQEIKDASIYWGFDYELFPDTVCNEGSILKISKLRR